MHESELFNTSWKTISSLVEINVHLINSGKRYAILILFPHPGSLPYSFIFHFPTAIARARTEEMYRLTKIHNFSGLSRLKQLHKRTDIKETAR